MSPRWSGWALLVPMAVVAVSFGQLALRGRGETRRVAENLPTPLDSTWTRVIELVRPTASFGRQYGLAFTRRSDAPSDPPGARVRVQVSTGGKTRLLVVREGGPFLSRLDALGRLLRGGARLTIVADRGWLDLGGAPSAGGQTRFSVLGLLPAPFGFAELLTAADPAFSAVAIWRPDAPDARVLATVPRYRIVAPDSAGTREVLARFFFFLSVSGVLRVFAVGALVLLALGWRALARGRAFSAAYLLTSGVVLLHSVCLPPLQGADETSHVATIERMAFGQNPPRLDSYPRSISLVAQALEQDRVQFHSDEALPLRDPAARRRLAEVLERGLAVEALQDGPPPPRAYVQEADSRSIAFYRPFRLLGPALRRMSVIDRVSLCRIASVLFALALIGAAVALLAKSPWASASALLLGAVLLIPYSVAALSSCSNYSPAIGLGALLAASALVLVLDLEPRRRALASGAFLAASWIGVFLWLDFALPAALATTVLLAWMLWRAAVGAGRSAHPARFRAGVVLGFAALLAGGFLVLRNRLAHLGRGVPLIKPQWGSAETHWMLAIAAAPLAIAGLLAFLVLRIGKRPAPQIGRLLRNVSIGLGLLALIAFLAIRRTDIPFETARLPFADLVRAYNAAFWSNNFSWDQDHLSWKLYWGVFGWNDTLYPQWVYAVCRWVCVGLFVALPALCARFIAQRPRTSALLLLVSGAALSFCVITETMRYLAPTNPWGRFLLPYLPLAALPVLVQVTPRVGERTLRAALGAAVVLQLWTALVVVGGRYAFGS